MLATKLKVAKYKVGDWVTYPTHPVRSHARVVEVRGPLAPGGEQVYRIRHVHEWGEVVEFETTESALQASEPPEHQPQPRPESEWALWTG